MVLSFSNALSLSKVLWCLGSLAFLGAVDAHHFTLKNNCAHPINPVIANVNCGYSPRCDNPGSGGAPNPAISYIGAQPRQLAPGASQTLKMSNQWNGRIFAQNGNCGEKGEGCTMAEFNLDTGNMYSAQAYDISNIQGFSHPMQISVEGCDTVTCTSADCGCRNGYAVGDLSGCGNDSPVRACSAGDHDFTVTFCP